MIEQWNFNRVNRLVALAQEKGYTKEGLAGLIEIDQATLWRLRKQEGPIKLLYSNAMRWVEQYLEVFPLLSPTLKIEQWSPERIAQLVDLAKLKGLSKEALARYIDVDQATLWRMSKSDTPARLLHSNAMALVEQWVQDLPTINIKQRSQQEERNDG